MLLIVHLVAMESADGVVVVYLVTMESADGVVVVFSGRLPHSTATVRIR